MMHATLLRGLLMIAALLCGCSSQDSALEPHIKLERSSLRPYSVGASIPALAVSSAKGSSSVLLFNTSGKRVGEINTPTYGWVSLDQQGDIYLSELNQPVILIYSPPYTQPPTAINLPGNGGQVAVDWKTGVFAVIASPSSPYGTNKILFFRHGETEPCKGIYPKFGDIDGAAVFDGEGTLFGFIVGNNGNDTLISIAGECKAKTYQTYTPALNMVELLFNADDQIMIDTLTRDYGPGPIITYSHPNAPTLGKSIFETYLKAVNGKGMFAMTMSSDGKTLWASNSANAVAKYNYPAGGAPSKSMDVASPDWVAAYPQLIP